jgi:peptide/nickel transport system substrate-binding protein
VLNPYLSGGPASRAPFAFEELTFDGLARGAPDGSYAPVLATEIPTQANGDVSADGTVVTWKLRPGVTWSDGQPFTSRDVVFTYQMIMDPANPVPNRSDYAVMDSVTAPDANTVVVTYKQLYAAYRLAFPAILPAHLFNGQTNLADNPFNLVPNVGTGPFLVQSVVTGDTITLVRNPNYREPGKPYLDQVIVKFTPDRDAEIQALEAGDLDAAWNLDETYLPQLATLSDVSVDPEAGVNSGLMSLFVNTSCSSGPQQGDPACPNAVAGDVQVRQAIELAIDKQALVHSLLADRVQVAGSLLPTGPFALDLPPSQFNPDKARQLLDQAGWAVGPDGIRSKGGVRAHLTLIATAGNPLYDQTAQVIQGYLQDVGLDTELKILSVSLTSPANPNSPFITGSFDLEVTSAGVVLGIDPQAYLLNHFASDQVASPQSQAGNNWERVQDPKLDQALAAAGSTLNDTLRQAAYAGFSEQLHADEAVIPLFPDLEVDARKNYVEGWQTNGNDNVTWNAQDWWLNR